METQFKKVRKPALNKKCRLETIKVVQERYNEGKKVVMALHKKLARVVELCPELPDTEDAINESLNLLMKHWTETPIKQLRKLIYRLSLYNTIY